MAVEDERLKDLGWELVGPRFSLGWKGATALFVTGFAASVLGGNLIDAWGTSVEAFVRLCVAGGLVSMPLAAILWARAIRRDSRSHGPLPLFLGRWAASSAPAFFLFVMLIAGLVVVGSPARVEPADPALVPVVQVTPLAPDEEAFVAQFVVLVQGASENYTAARRHIAQEQRYDVAEQEFLEADKDARWASMWADSAYWRYGLNASNDMVRLAVEYSQALATASRSGAACAKEYRASPDEAYWSEVCDQHEHYHALARQRSDAWVEEARRYR